jgi:hypothetical protein
MHLHAYTRKNVKFGSLFALKRRFASLTAQGKFNFAWIQATKSPHKALKSNKKARQGNKARFFSFLAKMKIYSSVIFYVFSFRLTLWMILIFCRFKIFTNIHTIWKYIHLYQFCLFLSIELTLWLKFQQIALKILILQDILSIFYAFYIHFSFSGSFL